MHADPGADIRAAWDLYAWLWRFRDGPLHKRRWREAEREADRNPSAARALRDVEDIHETVLRFTEAQAEYQARLRSKRNG